jgi:flagellar protein FliS
MNPYQNYSVENTVNGWTRIDMLLALYDHAISTIRGAQRAKNSNNDALFTNRSIEANKYILALHSGLDTEGDKVAIDIARLLNFVMLRLEEQNFDEAIYFLEKLQKAFQQIREEATSLEKTGKIPPLNSQRGLNTVA